VKRQYLQTLIDLQALIGWIVLLFALWASMVTVSPYTPIVVAIFGATLVLEARLGGKL